MGVADFGAVNNYLGKRRLKITHSFAVLGNSPDVAFGKAGNLIALTSKYKIFGYRPTTMMNCQARVTRRWHP